MDIRISHRKVSRETIPATGFLGALGAPGTPAGEEEVAVEVTGIDVPLDRAIIAAGVALINILQRDGDIPTEVGIKSADDDKSSTESL